jgi:hypothetical protein
VALVAFVLLACNARNDPPGRDASAGSAGGSGGRGGSPIGSAASDAEVAPSVDAVCGNGVLEGREQCDGAEDLKQLTCSILGLGIGFVRCVACRLDTRDCAPALAGCPDDLREAHGTVCFDPQLRCQYGSGCTSGACHCALDEPDDGQDAGSEDATVRDSATPIAHFSCTVTAC